MSGPGAPGAMVGNSLSVLGAQVVGNAGYFISVLVLARGLAPAERGAVAFVTVSALVISCLASVGAADATKVFAAQRLAERPRLLTNVVAVSACGALVGGGIACLALTLVPGAAPEGVGAVGLAAIAGGGLVGAVALAGAAFLQGCSRFRAYALVVAAGPWVYAALVGLIWAGWGLTVERAALAWVAAQAVPALLFCAAAGRGIGFGRPDLALARETTAFGLRAWLGGLAHLLNARVDQLLMGLMASQAALGTYAVAVNASEVLFYLPSAVAAALLPAVAVSGGAAGVERTLRVFRATTLVTLAAIGVAAALGPALLPLVFGEAYAGATEPFLWLLPSALGFAASAVFSTALLASGAPLLSSLGPGVSLVAGVTLDLVLIPRHGATGAAVAASAALLGGGAAASVAYGVRTGLRPAALVPRRADLELLARRAMRRAGARPS